MSGRYRIRPTSVGLLARGKDYSVKDLGSSPQGYTKLVERELGVSLDADSPMTRWTQLHELSHVRHSLWTPKRIAAYIERTHGTRVDPMLILGAEDARINEILRRRVPDCFDGYRFTLPPEKLRHDLAGWISLHASPLERDAAAVESVAAAVAESVRETLAPMIEAIGKARSAELTVLRTTVPLALAAHRAQEEARAKSESEGGEGESEPSKGESEDKDSAGDGSGESEPAPGEDDADCASKPSAEDKEDAEDGEEEGPADDKDEDGSDDSDSADDSEDEEEDDDSESGDGSDESEDEPDAEDGGDESEEGAGGTSGDAAPDDGGADVDMKDDREALGTPDATPEMGGCETTPGAGDEALTWVIPEVVEPPLTELHTGGAACVTTAETGNDVRWSQLYRIDTDGVCFRRARRRPGALQRGTVLIDASSSMAFTNTDLDELVGMLPHATVAIYSGGPGGDWDSETGRRRGKAWLVVVARNGRRVRSLADVPRGGGNMCDGPALLWLSRQPGPRLWLCDGYVTGTGDGRREGMSDECAAMMQAGQILQVCGGVDRRRFDRLAPYLATRELTERGTIWAPEAFRVLLRQIELGQGGAVRGRQRRGRPGA